MVKTGTGWEDARDITLETMKVLDEARRQMGIVFPADEKTAEAAAETAPEEDKASAGEAEAAMPEEKTEQKPEPAASTEEKKSAEPEEKEGESPAE